MFIMRYYMHKRNLVLLLSILNVMPAVAMVHTMGSLPPFRQSLAAHAALPSPLFCANRVNPMVRSKLYSFKSSPLCHTIALKSAKHQSQRMWAAQLGVSQLKFGNQFNHARFMSLDSKLKNEKNKQDKNGNNHQKNDYKIISKFLCAWPAIAHAGDSDNTDAEKEYHEKLEAERAKHIAMQYREKVATMNIHEAIEAGEVERVKQIIAQNKDQVNTWGGGAGSGLNVGIPLQRALRTYSKKYTHRKKILEILHILLDNGADVNGLDVQNQQHLFFDKPLHLAITNNLPYEFIEKMLKLGADPNEKGGLIEVLGWMGETSAYALADENGLHNLKALLEKYRDKKQSIESQMGSPNNNDADKKYYEEASTMNIHEAIDEGEVERIKQIIAKNKDQVNAFGSSYRGCGSSPLARALRAICVPVQKKLEMTHVLLDNGALINKRHHFWGDTPLHIAVDCDHLPLELIEKMLKLGADPNMPSEERGSAYAITVERLNSCKHYRFIRLMDELVRFRGLSSDDLKFSMDNMDEMQEHLEELEDLVDSKDKYIRLKAYIKICTKQMFGINIKALSDNKRRSYTGIAHDKKSQKREQDLKDLLEKYGGKN